MEARIISAMGVAQRGGAQLGLPYPATGACCYLRYLDNRLTEQSRAPIGPDPMHEITATVSPPTTCDRATCIPLADYYNEHAVALTCVSGLTGKP